MISKEFALMDNIMDITKFKLFLNKEHYLSDL